jgi:hypothetical protein
MSDEESARPQYSPTMFDRHGPDAGRRVMLTGYALPVFLLSAILFGGLASRYAFSAAGQLFFTLGGALACTAGVVWSINRFSDAAGTTMRVVTMGAGGSPYEEQFSRERALVMQGKVSEAVEAFEQRAAAMPHNIEVRIHAAELLAREGGNPERAAALLRQARAIPGLTVPQDIYVAHRLADLLSGPLREPGRALVELRRIIERYPGTPAARDARAGLSTVKARLRDSGTYG